MSSKEIWLVEGYDDGYENASEVELSEAYTSEDGAYDDEGKPW